MNFKDIQRACHRLPPLHYDSQAGQWIKPVTMDSDGCGEFKLIARLQKEVPMPVNDQTQAIHNPPKAINPSQDKEGLMNVKQLAAILNISPRRIWAMRSSGQMPLPVKLGGSIRWKKQEMLDWIQEGCPPI